MLFVKLGLRTAEHPLGLRGIGVQAWLQGFVAVTCTQQ